MIDKEGYRASVGAIIVNDQHRVFWAKRVNQDAWQFPQGGMNKDETPKQAMFRELYEEVGLQKSDVDVLGETPDWLIYHLPKRYMRHHSHPLCIGQKQKWFLLKIKGSGGAIQLDHTAKPEFDQWRWVYYWYPLKKVINFKRDVYRRALRHFEVTVFPRRHHRGAELEVS